jgi:hypothetical protein
LNSTIIDPECPLTFKRALIADSSDVGTVLSNNRGSIREIRHHLPNGTGTTRLLFQSRFVSFEKAKLRRSIIT